LWMQFWFDKVISKYFNFPHFQRIYYLSLYNSFVLQSGNETWTYT
jgi:hypothetical protein